jgi:uncharacterized protein YbcI
MIVVVVRLKHLRPLESPMVDGGEPERVLALRTEFARVMAGRYRHAVERVTGRTVVALLSQANADPTSSSRRSSSTDGSGQTSPMACLR